MSTIFIDEIQPANLLKQMWQECETDQFCDVILIAGAEEIKIPAHRSILATATGYFKGMFTSLRESREKEVKIPNLDGHSFKSLIQFIYTGRVEIREDNVQELLEIADMMFLNSVVRACASFLAERLDPANCLGFMLLAERFRCQLLLEYAKEYSLEHFMDVYKAPEFLKLNNEQLGKFLASDNLRATSEEHVFNSLLLWLEHDRCERAKYKDDLLKLVRMPLLEPVFLFAHVKPVCMSTESLQLYIEVMEWHLLQGRSALHTSISINPRSYQYLMGITANQYSKKMCIHYYCSQRLKWMRWMNDLDYRRDFGFAIIGHDIYIAGGSVEGNMLNTVICLNMKTMTLSPVSAMTERRLGCRAAFLNGFLYVLGGHDGCDLLNSVERWDPKTNAWNKVASMSDKRRAFGIAELNKKLFVFGGDSPATLSSAEYYDSVRNVWTSIAPMNKCRSSHGFAVANGFLYAVGGEDSKTVERYDSVTNQWSIISSLRESIYANNFCATFHLKVVACYKDGFHEYDDITNEWKTKESLKGLPYCHNIFSYSGELLLTEFVED